MVRAFTIAKDPNVPLVRRADSPNDAADDEPARCWEYRGILLVHPSKLDDLIADFNDRRFDKFSRRDMAALLRCFAQTTFYRPVENGEELGPIDDEVRAKIT